MFTKKVAVAVVVTALASTSLTAQDLMRDMERYCKADAEKYCPNDIADPKALIHCMIKKRQKLAPKCQPIMDKAAVAVGISVAPTQAPPESTKSQEQKPKS